MSKGLYQKYYVLRVDGRDADGEKHQGCVYFVLDLRHDPVAYDALRAYAAHTTDPALSGELDAVVDAFDKLHLCSDGAEKFLELMEAG